MLFIGQFSIYFICVNIIQAVPGYVYVNTTNGELFGVENVTAQNTTFWTFLGIPYAKPPIKSLRFRAPQPIVNNWTSPYNATYERNSCVETTKKIKNLIAGKEDCLYLNIFTINKPGNKPLVPVIVWIHGGAFIFGTGNTQIQKTEGFLDNGVIYVAINFRLGVFGFLSTENNASPGNYGLKDQIAALTWIKKNIANFGGDPDKITIFGESAGAVSVHYLLQSKLTEGLYRSAITDSGSTLCPWSASQNPKRLAFRIGRRNGILSFTSNGLIKRLRNVYYQLLQISASAIILYLQDIWNGLPWAPHIEPNSSEAVVTGKSYEQLQSGSFSRVPLLTGFNSNEARDINETIKISIAVLEQRFSLFPKLLVPSDMQSTNPRETGIKIKDYYLKNKNMSRSANMESYATDNYFVRPIRKTVQLYSQFAPVYFYRFAYEGGAAENHTTASPGAGHGEELQFLFNFPQKSAAANLTQQRMLKLWTNFVKYTNPTPPDDISTSNLTGNVTWPIAIQFGSQNINYLNIDVNLTTAINPEQDAMEYWDQLYKNYSATHIYNTY